VTIYQRAIDHFGVLKQLAKAEEELLELLTELVKMRNGASNDSEIVSEIADVTNMCEQLRLIFGPSRVDAAIDFKLTRLSKRIDTQQSSRLSTPPVESQTCSPSAPSVGNNADIQVGLPLLSSDAPSGVGCKVARVIELASTSNTPDAGLIRPFRGGAQ
jgi:hypothetical protein